MQTPEQYIKTLEETLEKYYRAMSGFAKAVRVESGVPYPWPAEDIEAKKVREILWNKPDFSGTDEILQIHQACCKLLPLHDAKRDEGDMDAAIEIQKKIEDGLACIWEIESPLDRSSCCAKDASMSDEQLLQVFQELKNNLSSDESLRLRPSKKGWLLFVRRHDLGGTDYYNHIDITLEQAMMLRDNGVRVFSDESELVEHRDD